MSRAQTKYRPNVEQVESRQMLSGVLLSGVRPAAVASPPPVPAGYMILSRQGNIDSIGDGFVGLDATVFNRNAPVYLSSLTNMTRKTLKINGVYASFSGRTNFTTASTFDPGGRILFWTQNPDAKFLIKLTVDKTNISTTGKVPAGAGVSATQFRKTGTGKVEVGWERIDFPLVDKSSTYTVTADKDMSGIITGIVVELKPTT
jgi:hypothetical protein